MPAEPRAGPAGPDVVLRPTAGGSRARRTTAWALAAFVGLAALYSVGSGGLLLDEPDEARCALVARHMRASGDWLVPHLLDEPYLEKPPLYFWMLAGATAVFGENEWAVRLPSAGVTAATVVLTGVLAAQLFGGTAGVLAGATFAASVAGVIGGRFVRPDMPLALWVTAALVCWAQAYLLGRSRRWYVLMYACAGLACLTKGPIGAVLPALVIAVYLLWTGRLRDLVSMRPLAGLLILLGTYGAWVGYMELHVPGYIHDLVLRQHLDRYAGSGREGGDASFWTLPGALPAALLPWTFLVALAAWNHRPRGASPPAEKFLWAWGLTVLAVFLPSRSRLPNYLLPMLPPTFILLGAYLARARQYRRQAAIGLWLTLAVAAAGGLAVPVAVRMLVHPGERLPAAVAQCAWELAGAAAGAAAVAGLTWIVWTRWPALAVLPLAGGVAAAVTLLCAQGSAREYFEYRSTAGMARMLDPLTPTREPLIICTEPRYGLVYYAPPGWRFEVIRATGKQNGVGVIAPERIQRLLAAREPLLAFLTGEKLYDLLRHSEQFGPRLTKLGEHRRGILVRLAPAGPADTLDPVTVTGPGPDAVQNNLGSEPASR